MNELFDSELKCGDIGKHKKQLSQCYRRWYPYATLIHRESELETLDTMTERLEKAMESCDPVIIVRSFHLGELIRVWWNAGNTILNVAGACSLASLVFSSYRNDRVPQALALGGLALQLTHACLWETDRLARYAIQPKNKYSQLETFKEAQEVVLVRKPETGSYILRTAMNICAVGVCAYFYYENSYYGKLF